MTGERKGECRSARPASVLLPVVCLWLGAYRWGVLNNLLGPLTGDLMHRWWGLDGPPTSLFAGTVVGDGLLNRLPDRWWGCSPDHSRFHL